jgi:hypothetical protein
MLHVSALSQAIIWHVHEEKSRYILHRIYVMLHEYTEMEDDKRENQEINYRWKV